VLKVGEVRFQLVYALGVFIRHPWIVALQPPKVEQCTSTGVSKVRREIAAVRFHHPKP
jgi:hypothetical protein